MEFLRMYSIKIRMDSEKKKDTCIRNTEKNSAVQFKEKNSSTSAENTSGPIQNRKS